MTSISVDSLSLEFPQHGKSLRTMIKSLAQPRLPRHHVSSQRRARHRILDNVSFSLAEGDSLALLGPNGAGKTTLLRCLAGLFQPTSGRLDVRGRVVSLINWHTGLDMEETGRENISALGYYLGMSTSEVRARMDEIINFSGLGEYVDYPAHTYSAGMIARLAFAVSTSVTSDILLLDEGINAGDAEFQTKAQERVRELVRKAGIVVLATHADSLAQSYCCKGLYLNAGQVQYFGAIDNAISAYAASYGAQTA
jgi:ABC-type polysaccharide/polyol phosphate transport system ATPase subunit